MSPRIITTVEELDGLQKGAVILVNGCALQRKNGYWAQAGNMVDFASEHLRLPAHLIYTPGR